MNTSWTLTCVLCAWFAALIGVGADSRAADIYPVLGWEF